MRSLLNFFKHKFVIVSLIFLLLGGCIFGALKVIPKSKSYESMTDMTTTDYVNDVELSIKVVVTFKDNMIITSNKYSDGRNIEISRRGYEIIDKILYVEGEKWGEIDALKIRIPSSIVINGKALDTGYYSPVAQTAQYISYALLGLGGTMFVLAVYVALTKKKN